MASVLSFAEEHTDDLQDILFEHWRHINPKLFETSESGGPEIVVRAVDVPYEDREECVEWSGEVGRG